MQRQTRYIIGFTLAALIVGLICVGGIAWLVMNSPSPLVPNTNIRDYQATLQRQRVSGLVNHFPTTIPAKAKNLRFSALFSGGPAGDHLQLRMKLPVDEVKRIETHLKESALYAYAGDYRDPKNDSPPPLFWTGDNKKNLVFPKHYTIYVLYVNDSSPAKNWMEGEHYGVAISTSASEVVYWSEDWH